jgi:hypothetical protein
MPVSLDRKQVDLGGLIKRLLIMHPFSKLSEADKMVAAGLLGGAMNEAIRLSQGPMTPDEIKHALENPTAVMFCRPRVEYDAEPVSLSDILHARPRRCFTCGETIDEVTLANGQMVTLDKDRVRHKLRCEKP